MSAVIVPRHSTTVSPAAVTRARYSGVLTSPGPIVTSDPPSGRVGGWANWSGRGRKAPWVLAGPLPLQRCPGRGGFVHGGRRRGGDTQEQRGGRGGTTVSSTHARSSDCGAEDRPYSARKRVGRCPRQQRWLERRRRRVPTWHARGTMVPTAQGPAPYTGTGSHRIVASTAAGPSPSESDRLLMRAPRYRLSARGDSHAPRKHPGTGRPRQRPPRLCTTAGRRGGTPDQVARRADRSRDPSARGSAVGIMGS